MGGTDAWLRASTLQDVHAAIADEEAWSAPDAFGRRTCQFHLGDDQARSTARVTRNPAGLLVETRGGDCRVEVVLDGSYEVAGTVREAGTITFLPRGRTSGPALIGPGGATTLEVFSTPGSHDETTGQVIDLREPART